MSLTGNVETMTSLNNIKGKITTVPQVDETLTKKGFGADAKTTGDAIKDLSDRINDRTVPSATVLKYDNLISELEAETIQGAIDEVAVVAKNALPKIEGYKPFGKYEGNGVAEQRVIGAWSAGKLVLVYNMNSLAFVTHEGAFVITLSDGSISWESGSNAFFEDGILTLLTTSDALNKADTTYYYQVI